MATARWDFERWNGLGEIIESITLGASVSVDELFASFDD